MNIITNTNIGKEDVTIYMMEEHGNAFCEIDFYKNEKHLMFLSNLNVVESERRKGNATLLLYAVLNKVSELGGKYLYLNVENVDSWICKWYKRLGFILYKTNSDNSGGMYCHVNSK